MLDVTEPSAPDLRQRFEEASVHLSRSEKKAARHLVDNPNDVMFKTALELGESSGTSDATILRAVKSLGYSGLPELKRSLGQEMIRRDTPASRLSERLKRSRSAGDRSYELVFDEAISRITETKQALDPGDFESAVTALTEAKTVHTWGLGPSSLEAQYAALRLQRQGLASRAMRSTGFHLADELLGIHSGDALLIYARGRRLLDLDVMIEYASEIGASVVLITNALAPVYRATVGVVLETRDSRQGLTRETTTTSVVTDALMLVVAARSDEAPVNTSETLTSLRKRLLLG